MKPITYAYPFPSPDNQLPTSAACTAKGRQPLKAIALALSCLGLASGGAQAGLTNRYIFDDNVNDSGVVGIHGTPTGSTANLEPPNFVTDIPPGTVAGAPTKSLQVGMNYGTKKSGFTLGTQVFNPDQGSMSFWAKATSLVNQNYLFTTSTDNDLIMLATGTSNLRNRAGGASLIDTTVATGTWYHFAITWNNATGTHKLYLNGSEVTGTNAFAPGILSANGFRIGSFNLTDDGTQLATQFAGQFYDLQFYNNILTPEEVTFLQANPGAAVPEVVNLAHRYLFDGNIRDAVGTQNGTATAAGANLEAPGYGTDAPAGATGPAKSIEFGMNIGTKKSGFTLPNPVISNQALEGSVSMFVRPDSDAPGADLRYIFTAIPGATGLNVAQLSGQTLRRVVAGSGHDFTTTAGQWYHVALTWRKSGPDLLANYYVDGSQVVTDRRIANKSITGITAIRAGTFNFNDDTNGFINQFDGRMYDLQVYRGVLTPAQVSQLNASPGAVIPELTPPFKELDPTAGVPAGYILKKEWHWAADGSLDGWTPGNFTVNLPGDVSGSVVTGTSVTDDPTFTSPEFSSTAPASGRRIIEIGVITDTGGTGASPELFWADDNGGIAASRRVDLPVLPADGAPHTIRVTFTGDIAGVLSRLRFDPSRTAGIISKIDFVRLYTDGPSDFTEGGASYATWSSGQPADGDANNDGVPNAVAYALGAANPNANAIGLLPDFEYDNAGSPTYLVFTFNRSNDAEADPSTTISVEYGSNLTGWTTAVHDPGGTGVIINTVPGSPTAAVEVKIPVSIAMGNKLFARLKVVVSP